MFVGELLSVFKRKNFVSITKATTDNNRNVSTKIVGATFENDVGSEEVSGENIWRNYGYFDAKKSNYSMEKVNFPDNTFSKDTFNFDTGYFDFLKNELGFLGRELEKSFEEKIVRHTFVFSLIDVHLEKIVYDLLPIKIFCHCFFCMRGSKNVGKCDVCSRFFVDDSEIASKIDQRFLPTKNSL